MPALLVETAEEAKVSDVPRTPPTLLPAVVLTTAVAFVLRLWLLEQLPLMPLGDSYGRLLHAPSLVQGVWLPGYQLPLAVLVAFTRALSAARWLNMAQGVLAVGAIAWLAGRLAGRGPAMLTGLLVAASPIFMISAMGLYQEGLFWALVGLGLVGVSGQRRGAVVVGVLLLSWAALTRYEGWFVVALVCLWLARGARGAAWPGWRSARIRWGAAAALLTGPALWLAWNQGVSAQGTRSLSPGAGAARWVEQAAIFEALVPQWIGWGLVGLAALGLAGALVHPRWRPWALYSLAFAALELLMLVLARPYAPANNWRQMHIPLVLLALWAGWGGSGFVGLVARLGGKRLGRRGGFALAGLCALAVAYAAAPPWSMVRSAPRWHGTGVVARVAALAELAGPMLEGGRRLLVLGGQSKDYEAGECQVSGVVAGLPRGRLVCGHELPDGQMSPSQLACWLQSREVGAIVWVAGFDELTPAHSAIKAWRRGAPAWATLIREERGDRLYALELAQTPGCGL